VIRAIVLAAGKGTRMKSARSKVLHEVCGRPMLWYVVQALRGAGIGEIVVVISPELRDEIERFDVESVVQEEQLGTGHAVRVALEHLDPRSGRLVVVCGDMPLVTGELLGGMAGSLAGHGQDAIAFELRAHRAQRTARGTDRRGARRYARAARNRRDECGHLCFRRSRVARCRSAPPSG
jgi:bifunctional UDP-N-acetylglucosamine pyrophosphorylase/glucosamine-1-phosphate N-acetyltransferase